MKNHQKGFAIIPSILIIALLIIGGGTYFVFRAQKADEIQKTALESGTPDWQIYKNDEYGFEFKSPARRVEIFSANSNNDYLGGTREFYGLYGESNQDFSARIDVYSSIPLGTVLKDNRFINTSTASGQVAINSIVWTKVGTENYLVEYVGNTYHVSGDEGITKPVLETFRFSK